jgi:hypothetical protein
MHLLNVITDSASAEEQGTEKLEAQFGLKVG